MKGTISPELRRILKTNCGQLREPRGLYPSRIIPVDDPPSPSITGAHHDNLKALTRLLNAQAEALEIQNRIAKRESGAS